MKQHIRRFVFGALALSAAGSLALAAEINDQNVVDASNTALFPESMPPSQLNNSARAVQGILARWYRDWNGSLATGGSTTAYTLSANQTLSAYFDGLTLTFEATATNTGPSTLNVDAVGAATIAKYGAVELESGDLANGQKYTVVYDGTRFQLATPVTPFASTVTSGNVPLFSGTTGRFTDSGYTPATLATDESGLTSVQQFTATGTWTKPTGITKVIVELVGGGAGGGGAEATGSLQSSEAGGGGAGGYAKKFIDVSLVSEATATVGAGGAGATAGANAGSAGGNSSWADGTNTVTANGGSGGDAGTTSARPNGGGFGGSGGSATGGDINAVGGRGTHGIIFADRATSGNGGASFFGGGGSGLGAGTGPNASTPGSGGGGGAQQSANSAAAAGGDGADGLVIVWEYK